MSEVALLVILPFAGSALALPAKLVPWGALRRAMAVASTLPLVAMVWPLFTTWPAVAAGETLLYALGGWPLPLGIRFGLDGLAWVSSTLILAISIPVALVALGERHYDAQFFFFLMVLVGGMQIVVVTRDIFTMFVAFEIVALAAYVLIAWEKSDAGLLASLKYLFLSSVGILFFLFGVFLVYRTIGTLSLDGIAAALGDGGVFTAGGLGGGTLAEGAARVAADAATAEGTAALSPAARRTLRLALAVLAVGIGVRTAFIPFHTWLPEAHAYAPHPISALLSGALIKVSFFAMVRILDVFGMGVLRPLLLWIGAGTALLSVIWALSQSDAKRLLAYHSISQMGYILAAIGIGAGLSQTAAMAHAVNHALFKSLLFLAVGTAVSLAGDRNLYRIGGVWRRTPLAALGVVVGALAIAGVPPFNGFASKALISQVVGGSPAYLLLQLTSVGTVASFIKLSRLAWQREGGAVVSSDGAAPAEGLQPHAEGAAPAVRGSPGPTLDGAPAAAATRAGALIFLAAACLATGVAAPALWRVLAPLLEEGAASGALPGRIFTLAKLGDAAATVALGTLLYALVVTRAGSAVAKRVRAFKPRLDTVLLFFVLGLGAFALAALV